MTDFSSAIYITREPRRQVREGEFTHIETMSLPLSRHLLRPASRCILTRQVQTRLPFTSVVRYYSSNQQPPAQEGAELGVGELQGANFKIEPLRRVGEDDKTKRARLICTTAHNLPLPTSLLLTMDRIT